MLFILDAIVDDPQLFILVLLRVTAYVFISPVFGRNTMPQIIKIGFSMFLGFLVFVSYDFGLNLETIDVFEFVYICMKEILLGIIMGFVSSIFFSVFAMAGKYIDAQVSFNVDGLIDPLMQTKMPLTGNLLTAMIMLMFFELDGHLTVIRIFFGSYGMIPISNGVFTQEILGTLLSGFYLAFLYATKIAMPIIIVMLVTEFALGIIVKFVPQMNVFVVGIPLRIFVGLMVFYFMLSPIALMMDGFFNDMHSYTVRIIYNMAG